MSKRRKLDRDGLEVYLLNLLLAYRPLLFVCGIFLLFYAIGMMTSTPLASLIALLCSVILLLMCYSYPLTLKIARLGAWIGTRWKRNA